jgi:hypothetical protein
MYEDKARDPNVALDKGVIFDPRIPRLSFSVVKRIGYLVLLAPSFEHTLEQPQMNALRPESRIPCLEMLATLSLDAPEYNTSILPLSLGIGTEGGTCFRAQSFMVFLKNNAVLFNRI